MVVHNETWAHANNAFDCRSRAAAAAVAVFKESHICHFASCFDLTAAVLACGRLSYTLEGVVPCLATAFSLSFFSAALPLLICFSSSCNASCHCRFVDLIFAFLMRCMPPRARVLLYLFLLVKVFYLVMWHGPMHLYFGCQRRRRRRHQSLCQCVCHSVIVARCLCVAYAGFCLARSCKCHKCASALNLTRQTSRRYILQTKNFADSMH